MRLGRFLALWLFANSAAASGLFDDLSADEQRDLRSGELIVKALDTQGRPGSAFEAYKLMPVPLSELYQTLTCFYDYPDFMPNVGRVDVRSNKDGTFDADYYLDLPMNQSKRYRLRLSADSGENHARLSWKQIPWPELSSDETIRDTQGYWQLQEVSGQTRVKYHVYTDPGEIPFGFGWIVDLLTRVSLPDVLNQTQSQVLKKKPSCSN